MTASTRRELRSAATSTSTTAIDLIRALTDARPIKPTSTRCLSARRPNPGRGSTYRRGNSVQTTAATSVEGDFDGVANTNSAGNGVVGPPFGTILVTSNTKWITTVAARFGVTNDTWLFYGKAGGGWVGYD